MRRTESPRRGRTFLVGAIAALTLLTTVPKADAFSSFKGRFGGTHPICLLEPGTQIWPEHDISAKPDSGAAATICPAQSAVDNCEAQQGKPSYPPWCDSILQHDRDCGGNPQASLGNDRHKWAGYTPYNVSQRRSWKHLPELGQIEVPVDIRVRVHSVTESDPAYSWAKHKLQIGPVSIMAPPRKVETRRSRWGAYDPRAYWGGWYEDCLCHTPHRYARGPLKYVYGDSLSRSNESLLLPAGTHTIRGSWTCPNRGSHSCGSRKVYQHRLRIEFLRCD